MKRSLITTLIIGVAVTLIVVALHATKVIAGFEAVAAQLVTDYAGATRVVGEKWQYVFVLVIALGVAWLGLSDPAGARRWRAWLLIGLLLVELFALAWVCSLYRVFFQPAPSVLVKPPRVKASPCALECKWLQTVRLTDLDNKPAPRFIAFGQVIGIHIDERFIKDGLLDTAAMKPISRAGYQEFFVTTADSRFSVKFSEKNRVKAPPPSKSAHE